MNLALKAKFSELRSFLSYLWPNLELILGPSDYV